MTTTTTTTKNMMVVMMMTVSIPAFIVIIVIADRTVVIMISVSLVSAVSIIENKVHVSGCGTDKHGAGWRWSASQRAQCSARTRARTADLQVSAQF